MGVMDDYYKFIFNLNIRGGGYRFNKCLTQKETERLFFYGMKLMNYFTIVRAARPCASSRFYIP